MADAPGDDGKVEERKPAAWVPSRGGGEPDKDGVPVYLRFSRKFTAGKRPPKEPPAPPAN